MRKRTLLALVTLVVVATGAGVPAYLNYFAVPGGGPLAATKGLYVDPQLPAARWVAANKSDPRAAAIRSAISSRPMARWFTGTSDSDIRKAVSRYTSAAWSNGHKLPVLVVYNLPGRDACGAQSSGGARDVSAYEKWVLLVAQGIGKRPAVVVVEPDALGDFSCMTAARISARLAMLNYATRTFAAKAPNTWTYIDAGNATWTDAETMAKRLTQAGIARAHGFAVNVSNYFTTARSIQYAVQVKQALGKPVGYVIDTSRNGNGDNGEWCNPLGRKLGTYSTANPGALQLWIQNPGNSDGACGIAPASKAGVFTPAIAQRLISGT